MDCVTSTHQGHIMTKLEIILKKKTVMLQRELANLESNELTEWEDLAVEARTMTTDYLEQVNGVEKELDAQAKEFHAKVDDIFRTSKKQLQDMKKTHLVILHQQEKMVSDGLEKVKQEIKECEDKLRNGSIESLLQYKENQEEKKATLPEVSTVMPPIFTPSQIDSQSLEEMFGKLTNQDGNQNAENESKHQDTNKSAVKGKTAPLQGATPTRDGPKSKSEKPQQVTVLTLPQRQLMSKPSVQSSFDTRFSSDFQSIACVGSGLAWVKTGDYRLQLMDQRGAVKDSIDTKFYFHDVVLSPQGELLLSNTNSNCIKSISPNKEVKTLFRTQEHPRGLCCLHSGNVVVTSYKEGRVVIYSRSGKIVQELDKKLFSNPYRVAQNKINNDLYICDLNDVFNPHLPILGKNPYGKMVALDASYNLRYHYTGKWNTFRPTVVCTDSTGRVLITDYWDHSVHILDKDGNFLQFLVRGQQGLVRLVSINADTEGTAWIGEESGKVTIVKYLQ